MFIKVTDGTAVAYSERELRQDNPNVSFPLVLTEDVLADFDVYEAQEVSEPYDDVLYVGVKSYVLDDGSWKQVWSLSPRPEAEAKARSQAKITAQVQETLDVFAQTKNYRDMFSAVGYASSTSAKFAEEAARCIVLRDQTWLKCYEILEEVENGARPIPSSIDDIASELPDLTWS